MAVTKVQFVSGTIGEILKQLPPFIAAGFKFSGNIKNVDATTYRIRLVKDAAITMTKYEFVVNDTFAAQDRINTLLSQGYVLQGDALYSARGCIQLMFHP